MTLTTSPGSGFGFAKALLRMSQREQREVARSEEHTSELQSPCNLVCRLLLEKKNTKDLSTLKPGQNVPKTYNFKVTSTKDGDVIDNTACFTAKCTAIDNPQNSCDVATITVPL